MLSLESVVVTDAAALVVISMSQKDSVSFDDAVVPRLAVRRSVRSPLTEAPRFDRSRIMLSIDLHIKLVSPVYMNDSVTLMLIEMLSNPQA